ncbi:MAG: N-acetyltransferase family protein [Planctomycetia bacterium]|nr:MAG: N-acetyltransferase family protein [Planctomycetia bacterium]
MILRDFAAADVPAANAITNHYIRHTQIHFAYEPESDADFEAYWRGGHRRFPWIVAEVDGRVVGYCKCGAWRDRVAYRRTVEAGLYVASDCQRRGIGRALYTELLARLDASDVHTVVAGIALPNEASVRLHEALGFQPVGTFREVGWKFDQWCDVGFWQLMLRAGRCAASEPPAGSPNT